MKEQRRPPRTERIVDAIAGRLGAGRSAAKAGRKVFPNHFSFLWGEIALYSFVVLVATGIYLTFFFEPSQERVTYEGSYEPMRGQDVSAAYDSVMRISFDVRAGLLVRQVHHWAALVFVAAIALHMFRVFFTGAHRRPREINWVIGALLLVLSLAGGFSGYSLPDDLLSGSGLRITYSIVLSLPLAGEQLVNSLFGGEWPGTEIISRLYAVHVVLIPAAIVALLTVHLIVLVRQKHTQFPGPGRTERNVVGLRVWPGFAMKSVGLFFLTAGVLTALGAVLHINTVWLYGPYQPSAATSYSQPDWYIGFLEGSLRLFPPWETRVGGFVINQLVYSGVVVPGLIFAAVFLAPWIERRITGDGAEHHLLDRPRDAPGRTATGAAGVMLVTILFVGGGQDVVARMLDTPVGRVTVALQLLALIAPPVTWFVTWNVCRALQQRPYPDRTERAVAIVRDRVGGYHTVGEAAAPTEALDAELQQPVTEGSATKGDP
ncbi:MAG TPA: ubiquinol-cytochrome c reductase cytochrome b subunit [Ilumatobacter sp.]|nr:ubiquinol-cytochrome c reductase cytochrome b subunit [Ilumatobacter sp.]